MKIVKIKTIKTNLKMKNTLIKRIVPLLGLVFIFQACSSELDQVNPNALTTSSFWKNSADLDAGLNATYAALRNEDIQGILTEPMRTDIATPRNFRNNTTGNPIYDQTFDLTTNEVQDKWDACFKGIFRANQVLDAYARLKPTFNGEKSVANGVLLEAQARALRGYFYYVLHSSYNEGSLPLYSTVPKAFDDFQKTFSTSEEIKAFYREDLKYGMENLPGTYNLWRSEVGAGNLGRITGGACEALIAKSYINDNDFVNAELYLKNVIDNYDYALVDDLEKCLTGIEEFNSESIFEVNYSLANLLGSDEQDLSQRVTSRLHNSNDHVMSSWLNLAFRAERPDPSDPANYVDRPQWDPATGKQVVDADDNPVFDENVLRKYSKRMASTISIVDEPDSPMYGVTSGEFGNDSDASPHSKSNTSIWKKFTSWNVPNGGKGELEDTEYRGKSELNIPVIRLAEIYLLYAECMIEKGNLSEALLYINKIRKRSHLYLLGNEAEFAGQATYLNDIDLDDSNGEEAVTLENLMDHLRFVEKPLELCLEGQRTVDLRRWGVWKERLVYLAQFEYDSWNYRKNLNGKHNHRYRSYILPTGEVPTYTLIKPGKLINQGNGFSKEPTLRDCLLASQNFVESLNAYYPIPQDERNANLNWNK
ncbi:RagB/SusD family nutrient uptake outer membrane protein [Polaribacter sp. Z014]|uniref:RagB/SusD family nutrient uptake outer membrane protein n=1 Tax=Polaribacter sp. Z014 TaxID=2927126 RepID=UPI002020B96B|nr:RagB/SusD family nutrient uptake outer membrane protein [Polaribacter sp. Z014]MCL7763945.1 RagB/SusD family nutrient uptake outer membrane protein [Polaribacter sp. Z014]